MNFSIHLDDDLAKALNAAAEREGRARNALIREAIAEFLSRRRPRDWPDAVRELAGMARNIEPFESHRLELAGYPEDPLS